MFQYEDEKSHLTEIIRLKEMEKNNLDKSLAAKDEEKRLQAVIDGKTYEWKQQEFEIHMASMQYYLFTLVMEKLRNMVKVDMSFMQSSEKI